MLTLFRFIQRNWALLSSFLLLSVTALSLWPLNHLPEVPGTDKTHHFTAYAAIFFPIALAWPKRWLVCFCGCLLASGAIELIQPYVNRYGEWLDMAANAGGLFVGLLLGRLCAVWLASRQVT